MSSIVNRDWTQLVRACNLDNWREILAALVTYASPDEFPSLCGKCKIFKVALCIFNGNMSTSNFL